MAFEQVRAQVVRVAGQGDEVVTGQIPFTPPAKNVLDLALREALSLGHNYIGTEHILLSLLREGEGVAAQILLDFDADPEQLRNEIMGRLGRHPGADPTGETPELKLVLRRVVPIAQRLSDGTWVVSVEVWDHGIVVNSARPEPWPLASRRLLHGWRVTDDLARATRRLADTEEAAQSAAFRYEAESVPAPPSAAGSLQIGHETADYVSVSLID